MMANTYHMSQIRMALPDEVIDRLMEEAETRGINVQKMASMCIESCFWTPPSKSQQNVVLPTDYDKLILENERLKVVLAEKDVVIAKQDEHIKTLREYETLSTELLISEREKLTVSYEEQLGWLRGQYEDLRKTNESLVLSATSAKPKRFGWI
jgi:hypothetical protein